MTFHNRENVALPRYVQGGDADPEVIQVGTTPPLGSFPNSYTPQSGSYEWLHTVTCILASSATIANRYVFLRVTDDQGRIVSESGAFAVQTSSASVTYYWSDRWGAAWGVSGFRSYAPGLALPFGPGWLLNVLANNFQATDQFGPMTISLSRFSTGAQLADPASDAGLVPVRIPIALGGKG